MFEDIGSTGRTRVVGNICGQGGIAEGMFSRVSTEKKKKSTGWEERCQSPVQSIIVGKLYTMVLESLGKYLANLFKFPIILLDKKF